MSDTNNGTALVTGASSGIGAAFARILAERGMNLIITARRDDRLQTLAAELQKAHSVSVDVVAHDLGAPDGAVGLMEKVDALGKNVTVLVNNAGFGVYGNSWELQPARVASMIELNMTALTVLSHHYAAKMVERGQGRILQVASIGAYQPSPLYAVYAATKAYVLFFSQAMNYELRGTGVTVTTLCPGLTESEFHEVADHVKPKSMDKLMMPARQVANIGISAMFKGKAVITPGFMNKLSAFMVKLFPRSWSTAVAGRMMSKKREDA
jgi:short-subunit dehydrogenase